MLAILDKFLIGGDCCTEYIYVGNNCKVLYEYSNLYVGDHDEVPDEDRM